MYPKYSIQDNSSISLHNARLHIKKTLLRMRMLVISEALVFYLVLLLVLHCISFFLFLSFFSVTKL